MIQCCYGSVAAAVALQCGEQANFGYPLASIVQGARFGMLMQGPLPQQGQFRASNSIVANIKSLLRACERALNYLSSWNGYCLWLRDGRVPLIHDRCIMS